MSQTIAACDQRITELAAKHPELERLESIPGDARSC